MEQIDIFASPPQTSQTGISMHASDTTSQQSAGALVLASIVITTRNRKDEVVRAIDSCLAQSGTPLELLIFDDASTDGTYEQISTRYAQHANVRCFRGDHRRGLIALRNWGFHEARGKYVFSLDDDAYYTRADTVERTAALLERSPDVAAVAMPYVEPGRTTDGVFIPQCGTSGDVELRSYVGCAHAVRREAVLAVGGYRELLIHQGEESDLGIRLIERGFRIIYGDATPIVHAVSPVRDMHRMDRFGVRNTLLFDVLNVPNPYVVPRFMIDCVQLLLWMPGWPKTAYRSYYLLCALGSCLKYAPQRRAVSRAAYQKFRSLPRHGPEPWKQEPVDSGPSIGIEPCISSH
jgi:glycosyltransferase involved in cell wall biosynthesis